MIKTVHIKDIKSVEVIEHHLKNEVPLIIKGLNINKKNPLSLIDIVKKYKDSNSKEYGWYTVRDFKEYCPNFLLDIFSSGSFAFSEKPKRIFCQPRGHKSLLHYDGNSIHGYNYQYLGKKKWTIFSPDSNIRMMPFMYIALINNSNISKVKRSPKNKVYDFVLNENEMLFLPRYWLHIVESKAQHNVNFNWVLTPKHKNNSIMARREIEVLKLRLSFPIINKAFFPTPVETYAGGNKALVDEYIKEVSKIKLVTRLLKELFNYSILPFYFLSLKKYANDFKENNFKITDIDGALNEKIENAS